MLPKIAGYMESCFLETLNPSLESVTISTKKSNSFSSEGIELGMKPNPGKKLKEFPPQSFDVSDFSDILISEEVFAKERNLWGSSFEVFQNPAQYLSEAQLDSYRNQNIPFLYFKYPSQHVFCVLTRFRIVIDPKVFLELETAAKFLWYRSQILGKTLLKLPETDPGLKEIRRDYLNFLLQLCYDATES